MAPVPASAVRTSCHNKGDSNVLPEFLALRSPNSNKFLGYRTGPADYRGHLRFEYDDIWSPYAKLQVVTDKKSGLISIRCCYNNRFWRRWDASHWWIVAGEDTPNRDPSNVSCTLFDFVYDVTRNILSLRLLQLNKYAADWRCGGDLDRCLYAGEGPGSPDSYGEFVVHDMDSMIRLPRNVVFKGDNGLYLGYASVNGVLHLAFNESDVAGEHVVHTVQETADGTIALICKKLSRFWYRNPPTSLLTVDSDSSSCRTLLEPVAVDDRKVALRCLDNRLFCKRYSCGSYVSCFSPSTETADWYARLEVGEPVMWRKIHSIEFNLDGAYIYDTEPLVLATSKATNRGTATASLTVAISYTKRRTEIWDSSYSFTAGVKAEFQTGIPFVAEAKVEVSAQGSFTHAWGEQYEETEIVQSSYTAPVESGRTLVVKAVATKAKCDVKFSYTQTDRLTNGKTVRTEMDDGVFTGMNCYGFKFESSIE